MSERGFEQVPLGDSGMSASAVGFGTYHLREKLGASEAIDAMGSAFEAGITLYDTSDNYGTEELIGLAVREGVLPRDQVVIATKTGLATSAQEHLAWSTEGKSIDTSPERVKKQVEKSLRLLGEDVGIIDLYQLHGRGSWGYTTARAMDELIKEGKIRAYGISNYSAADMADLLCACEEEGLAKPTTSQPFANAIYGFDDEAAAVMAREGGMTILAHSPLHKGMLSEEMIATAYDWVKEAEAAGHAKEEIASLKEGLALLESLSERAIEAGHNLARLAVAWVATHPDTVVLSSPTNSSRLNDVYEGAAWQLDDETLEAVRDAQGKFKELNFANMTLNLMRILKIYYK
jgi:aryl-alcohol dehydrogenase-like predicted oxidoreductase